MGFCYGLTAMNVIFIKKIDFPVLNIAVPVLSLSEEISSDIYFTKGGIRYEVFGSGR